jgi:tetratricopeptide (TPR) repeat protein
MDQESYISKILKQATELKASGNSAKAIRVLHSVLMEDHNCVSAYEELGDNYISLRQLDKAEKALDQAVKIDPKTSNARYLRGFLYSLQEKWNKSVEELERANEMAPNHPEILRCLGWSLYNENRGQKGLAILERSETLRPSDPNILCDLGVCYMNSKDFTRARIAFQKVIDTNPNSAQARECLNFLNMLEEKRLQV